MKKNEQIKETIVQKTKELIALNANVTIKEIASACFVNIAAVNYHFGSKDTLIEIVLNLVIDELKQSVSNEISKLPENANPEFVLEKLMEHIYRFALSNTGIVKYFFLQTNNQRTSSNHLVNSFFSDNEFTRLIFIKLSASTGLTDPEALRARYLVLFSAFAIPLFIQIAQDNLEDSQFFKPLLSESKFRDLYINELIRLVR